MDEEHRAAPFRATRVLGRPSVLVVVYLPPVFFGALLMFWSELLIGKMVLPFLGGAPMVWTTCLVFFQSLLLAGYAGAHWSMRLRPGLRVMLHVALILGSLSFLPLGADAVQLPAADADPRPWLIGWLTVAVGAPFLVLAAAGPLLQAWFARTNHYRAADPYFLYVASNAGSLIGLLAFPLLAEPQWTLTQQSAVWSWAYGAFAALLVLAALAAARGSAPATVDHTLGAVPTARDRIRWVALAFAPSSLLLGLTSLIATDIAAIPLIWMLPLAAYLITFMISFARRPPVPHWMALTLHPAAALPALFFWFWDIGAPSLMMIGLLFAGFFMTALVCHGELARTRPAAMHLTDFYLCLSLGGLLGGLFNLLIAPLVFARVFEFPLVMVLALLLRPASGEHAAGKDRRLDLLVSAGWFAAMLAALLLYREELVPRQSEVIGILSVLMAMFFVLYQSRRLRFGLIAAGLLFANQIVPPNKGDVVHASRNFFGVLRVVEDRSENVRYLYNGTTQHGAQHTDRRRLLPISYYAADGPLGQAFALPGIDRADAVVAAVGLGAGAAACHARKGQRVIFYEIDPAVKRIAGDPKFFTYLRDCPARSEVVLGDGRIMLGEAPAESLDLIVLDAFNSDAIPVHLLTREATALYRSRLKPDGVLLVHTSNRYLDLTRVLAALARDAGLSAFLRNYEPPDDAVSEAVSDAEWVLLAPVGSFAAQVFGADDEWSRLEADPQAPLWTDSFSSLLGILR